MYIQSHNYPCDFDDSKVSPFSISSEACWAFRGGESSPLTMRSSLSLNIKFVRVCLLEPLILLLCLVLLPYVRKGVAGISSGEERLELKAGPSMPRMSVNAMGALAVRIATKASRTAQVPAKGAPCIGS